MGFRALKHTFMSLPAVVVKLVQAHRTSIFIGLFAVCFAFVVVMLGAYVRLSDAGLGCPDWPGCYGSALLSDEIHQVAESAYGQTADFTKALKEMLHRYVAGILVILILGMAVIDAIRSKMLTGKTAWIALPNIIFLLVVVQALFGMWTVTLKLQPMIVVLHLLLGMTLLLLLWWYVLEKSFSLSYEAHSNALTYAAIAGIVILYIQIFLGGWTSANYAALACTDFPACRSGQWWPAADFNVGFTLWQQGENFEGGVLDLAARTAIHLSHRLWAVVVFFSIFVLAIYTRRYAKPVNAIGKVLFIILVIQVALGIANVIFGLPLLVAVAHNGVAALLLLSLGTLIFFSRRV